MLSQRYLKLSSFLKIVFSLYSVQLERFSLFCLLVCGFIPLCHLIYCWVLPVFFIFISFTLFLLHSSDLLGSSYFLFHRYSSDCLHPRVLWGQWRCSGWGEVWGICMHWNHAQLWPPRIRWVSWQSLPVVFPLLCSSSPDLTSPLLSLSRT